MIINVSKQVCKFLKKIPVKQAKQISHKILSLKDNQFPHDSKKLQGKLGRFYRVDVGEFRIIYKIEDDEIIIPIVGKRNDSEVYKLLNRKIN